MKANEFVKKFGWLRAKQILKYSDDSHRYFIADGISTTYSKYGDGFYSLADLKRLVESHELVKEHGSLERAKMYAESMYTAPEVVERMKQAVADVESCL
ncbi:hypothetical protein [Acinetobacter sp. YH16053]|uniref:hypothetical protein n=1 Tax=Acinetobacter sp. YH16053 TaxID=2601192 RepID=UPI0015D120B9|nr:hypothetical protein [Acinetobacter sp. YH16053]